MMVCGLWAAFPMGGPNYGAEVVEVRSVLGSPDYEAATVSINVRPVAAIHPVTVDVEVLRQSGGVFAVEQLVCDDHLKLCSSPVPFSRKTIDAYQSFRRPISMAGGGFVIRGPWRADGLFVRIKSNCDMVGDYVVDFRRVVGPTSDVSPPPDVTPEKQEEPECRCRSILWGHEPGCPWRR